MSGVLLPGMAEQPIKEADQKYLEKHKIKDLMAFLLKEIITTKPKDPIQFLVDALSFEDPEMATQDKYGLSAYRKRRLLEIFHQMDKNRSGYVSYKEVQAHSSKYGGQALTESELREVFRDFDQTGDNKISEEEFLLFFSRAVQSMDNSEFDNLVMEMLD